LVQQQALLVDYLDHRSLSVELLAQQVVFLAPHNLQCLIQRKFLFLNNKLNVFNCFK
jgi:hypothetical protein